MWLVEQIFELTVYFHIMQFYWLALISLLLFAFLQVLFGRHGVIGRAVQWLVVQAVKAERGRVRQAPIVSGPHGKLAPVTNLHVSEVTRRKRKASVCLAAELNPLNYAKSFSLSWPFFRYSRANSLIMCQLFTIACVHLLMYKNLKQLKVPHLCPFLLMIQILW